MTATKGRKKPLYQHGEYIDLNWDGDQTEEYVRGHVTSAEFADAFKRYHYGADDPYRVPVPDVTHRYGRWSSESCVFDGLVRVLRIYDAPGAGRFPLTVAPYETLNPPQHLVETPNQFCRRHSHRQVWDIRKERFRCVNCHGWPEGHKQIQWIQDPPPPPKEPAIQAGAEPTEGATDAN